MKRRVLVVDDDELTLEILRTILDLEDFDVLTARSGEEALEAVEQSLPDLVVCDVMMPDIDGLEVTRRIRKMDGGADLPIVLLTAKTQDEDRQAGFDAGCTEYVTKPFSPLSLITTLGELATNGKRAS